MKLTCSPPAPLTKVGGRNHAWRAALVLVSLIALMSAGCATPRSRLGALPFPGATTLYKAADPERLGRHRHGRWPRWFRTDESERGILYTQRAGFLDVAHVRMAIDWTRYYVLQSRRAIATGQTTVTLVGTNYARVHLALRYPADWSTMDAATRAAVTDELSLRMGQQLAYLMLTWHEVISWFGHRNVFFLDESASAFTYDDITSHAVGMRVAAVALTDATRPFDDAATAALSAELAALGVVTPRQTDDAVAAVNGQWWAKGKPLKRQLDVGLDDLVLIPWLVPAGGADAGVEAEPIHLPRLNDVFGRDLSDFYTVQIEPRILETNRMRQNLPGQPKWFERDRDVTYLIDVIERQMKERFGPDVTRPGR